MATSNKFQKEKNWNYSIEAWVCGCITRDELDRDLHEYAIWKDEQKSEGAWLTAREYDPQADIDESVWF